MPIKLYHEPLIPLILSIYSILFAQSTFVKSVSFFVFCLFVFIFVVISYVDCTHVKSSKVSFVLMICIHNIYVIGVDKRVIRLCDNYCIAKQKSVKSYLRNSTLSQKMRTKRINKYTRKSTFYHIVTYCSQSNIDISTSSTYFIGAILVLSLNASVFTYFGWHFFHKIKSY